MYLISLAVHPIQKAVDSIGVSFSNNPYRHCLSFRSLFHIFFHPFQDPVIYPTLHIHFSQKSVNPFPQHMTCTNSPSFVIMCIASSNLLQQSTTYVPITIKYINVSQLFVIWPMCLYIHIYIKILLHHWTEQIWRPWQYCRIFLFCWIRRLRQILFCEIKYKLK